MIAIFGIETSWFRHAAEIRVRAERRCGELLKDMPKATGGQPYQSTGKISEPVEKIAISEIAAPYGEPEESKPQTLAEFGISKRQSSEWQQLAAVPEEEFEVALAEPEKPHRKSSTGRPSPATTNGSHQRNT
jgi:hypothetical protein